MRRKFFLGLGLLAAAGGIALAPAARPKQRTVECTYTAIVEQVPQGSKSVSIWLPYPVSDAHQTVEDVKVHSPVPGKVYQEPRFGNRILHLSSDPSVSGPIEVDVSFKVTRKEYERRAVPGGGERSRGEPEKDLSLWLKPDKLVPLDDRIRSLAQEVVAGKNGDLERAHAIFDYVVSTMKYDKSGTGWGRGDILWACDAKRGNCSDFHALFIGLCRACGIPARFSIGFPLPDQRGEGEVPGYHCWAEFYLRGTGWIPVDASEANKHPEKRDYFFGAHDENRVQLSTGRDIVLEPRQAGGPLNFFVYPYVEVDGKPFDAVKKRFTFRDLGPEKG